MKLFLTLILPLALVSCASFEKPKVERAISSDDQNVNCYQNFCVGDLVLSPYSRTKTEAIQKITSILLENWDCNGTCPKIIVPKANYTEVNGMKKYIDLRSAIKYVPDQKVCTKIKDVQLCTGQTVGVLPEGGGSAELSPVRIFRIEELEQPVDRSKKFTAFIVEDSVDPNILRTTNSVAIMTDGFCFSSDNQFCIGSRYNNGVGSEDQIQAYLPASDNVIIAAGDHKGEKYLLTRLMISDRMAGKYEKSFPLKNITVDGKKNKKEKEALVASRAQIFSEATRTCSYEFLGMGVFDQAKSGEPVISNCSWHKEPGGFGDKGYYGPSKYVKCDVEYTYYCTHKALK